MSNTDKRLSAKKIALCRKKIIQKKKKQSFFKLIIINLKIFLEYCLDIKDGNFLRWTIFQNNIILIILIILLFFFSIIHRYSCELYLRENRELTKEIQNLNYEYLYISSDLKKRKRGSMIEDEVKEQNPKLTIPRTPSYLIK
jgi:hypothetical protein